jgi:small subunit ribosomal protein S13
MARIAGVDLPRGKRLEIALTYIYGIGRSAATKLCDDAGIPREKTTDDLDENDVRGIRDVIEAASRSRVTFGARST